MTRLLNGTITAHDVRDLEALVRRALDDELNGRDPLPPDKYDDALGYLLADAWRAAKRYDPSRARPDPNTGSQSNFSTWCYRIVRKRYTDWLRWSNRDHRGATDTPGLLYLDAPYHGPDHEETGLRLHDTIPSRTGDPSHDRSPDLVRTLHPRNSETAQLLPWQNRKATGGARR